MFLFHLIRMVKNQTFKINPDPVIMNNLLKISIKNIKTQISWLLNKKRKKQLLLGMLLKGGLGE